MIRDSQESSESASFGGSIRWMAPELHQFNEAISYTPAADVYSFACVCYEVSVAMYF
jgi:serine/threonine protein kinase